MKDIIFVTSNKHKLSEAREILQEYNINALNLDILEIQGNEETIAKHKAVYAFEKTQGPCFIEDTSLYFNAWNNLPGPYIKSFLENLEPSGLHKALSSFDDKAARAVCTIGYMDSSLNKPLIFKGEIKGSITTPRGESGFEWDKIFIPSGYKNTFAELGMKIKNSLSHRKKALILLSEYLNTLSK